MGNGVGLIIGLLLMGIGVIVAVFTASGFMTRVLRLELASAFVGYLVGVGVAIIFLVVGGLLLLTSAGGR